MITDVLGYVLCIRTQVVPRLGAPAPVCTRGGGGIAVRECQIQLRKPAETLWEKGGAGTKPPEASRSNTSAQVAQKVSGTLQTWSLRITVTGGDPQYHHGIQHEPKAGEHCHPIVLPLGDSATL